LNELNEYDLPAEEKDEEILVVMHKHYFTLFKPLYTVFVIILIYIILLKIFGFVTLNQWILLILAPIIIFLIYKTFFIFNNDVYILTNKRIIDIDQKGFFNRSVTEANLEKIQNTQYEINGILKTFLDFGNVIIKTAGSREGIVLENVANPYEVQQKILQAQKDKIEKSKKESFSQFTKNKKIVLR